MNSPKHLSVWHHSANILASWFYAGYSPIAPGTLGSLLALPCAYLISKYLGISGLIVAVIIIFIIGVWAAKQYSDYTNSQDSPKIVIDEVAGQWITLLLVPPDLVLYVLGFFLFRLMDIVKPWPISAVDRRIKSSFGVMFDDVLAGGISGLILWNIWMWTNI